MPVKIPVEVEGTVYRSFADACAALGLSKNTVWRWQRARDLDHRAAILEVLADRRNRQGLKRGIGVTIEGITYPSISSACRALGLCKTQVSGWISFGGLSHVEAVRRALAAKRARPGPCA